MFGIDHESLKLIQNTAVRAEEIKIVPMPNDPERHVVIGNGTHQVISTPRVPKPRKHVVETIASFAAAYARWREDGDSDGPGGVEAGTRKPNIWLNLADWRLLFFTDEPFRLSQVTLKLTPAPQWHTISQFRSAVTFDQKALVRLLRHDLIGCVDPGVLPAFRSVDFMKMQNARRVIEHGKQSIDGDIKAEVVGERKPEEIVAMLPMLVSRELPDFRARVVLTIDIDADAQRFVLQARPGELDLSLEELKGVIEGTLEGALAAAGCEGTTILAGNPGE